MIPDIALIYANTPTYNGIKTYSKNLYKGLLQEGMDARLYAKKQIELRIKGKKYFGWASSEVLSHVFPYHGKRITHATADWEINKHTNVLTIHDLTQYNEWKKGLISMSPHIQKHFSWLFRRVHQIKIITPSRHVENQIREVLPDADISVITIAVNPSLLKTETNWENPYPDDGKLHLVTMGEIYNKRKRIRDLYEFVKERKDVTLHHIGMMTDEFRAFSQNIIPLGQVDEKTKLSYLKFADKFIFYTKDEGQGIPTMEAMRCNTQVIVNDIPIHRELLGDRPYYFHDKEEFLDLLYKPKKSGLVEQISQYDNWIQKHIKAYDEVIN